VRVFQTSSLTAPERSSRLSKLRRLRRFGYPQNVGYRIARQALDTSARCTEREANEISMSAGATGGAENRADAARISPLSECLR
jgi:hypothetical protein